MTYNFILTLITLILSLSLSFGGFYLYHRKLGAISSSTLRKELAFAPIYLCSIIFLPLLYAFSPIQNDFVRNFTLTELLVPLILTGVCYVISLFSQTSKFLNPALIFSATIAVFFLPNDFMIFNGVIPFWADRLVTIILWSVFSCFFSILNGIDGILPIYGSGYLITLAILSLSDAAPVFLGLAALSLLSVNGSFLIFNWAPAKISLTDNSSKVFGFLLGSLMIFGCSENLAPCFAIILTIFALELLQAVAKKLSMRSRYEKLSINTIYYQAHISGLPQEQVCYAVFKIQILFIILSCFQAYLPNNYSLPIASLFLAAWFLNKLKHWDEEKQTLKEINQEFVNDLRQNINEIKNNINRE